VAGLELPASVAEGAVRLQAEWSALNQGVVACPVDVERLMDRHHWIISEAPRLAPYQAVGVISPGDGLRRLVLDRQLSSASRRAAIAYFLLHELRGQYGALRLRWPIHRGALVYDPAAIRALTSLLVPASAWRARTITDLAEICDIPIDLAGWAVRWMPEPVRSRFTDNWVTFRFTGGAACGD